MDTSVLSFTVTAFSASTGTSVFCVVTAPASTTVVTGLANGQMYVFTVTATYAADQVVSAA
ncbi:MAG TPA: hypothetical protein VF157_05315, partial [Chloroflexota bacterium]